MADFFEAFGRFGADALRWTVMADQFGKALLDRVVAPPKSIIFGVRKLRRIFLVIQPVIFSDVPCQAREFGLRLLLRQQVHRFVGGLAHARARLRCGATALASARRRRAAARASSVTFAPDSMR